jgi:RNA 3'-terminal phosphate cyclase (ATP)
LRNSTSLAAILGKPIHIINIRSGRASGGLKAQHLTGIELVSEMYSGKLTGNHVSVSSLQYVDKLDWIYRGHL